MQRYTVRYLVACTLLAVVGLAGHALTRRQPQGHVKPPDWAHTLPRHVGGWTGQDIAPDKEVADYLAADALLVRRYTREGRVVDVTAVFGTRWRALHSPAGCYPSQGWQIQERSEIEIAPLGPLPHPGPLHAEKLVVKQADRHLLVLYLYAHPGGTTASWVQQCLKVTSSRGASGGIVLIVNAEFTPQTESKVEADARQLVSLIYPYLVKHWYEH
ncbi:MAG: EpsI family protein [Armatimonadetes bacterium]|nr:EpsI family protein [Armatimonadota bacterium]